MTKKFKIAMIVSEVSPFSKTGGLAEVARALPKAIRRLGHEVIIITPLYSQITDPAAFGLKPVFEGVELAVNSRDRETVDYLKGHLKDGLPVYFVDSKRYFNRKDYYGGPDDAASWLVFDVAALKLISLLKFPADIIHCHDRQTGLIPYYLKTNFRYSKTLEKARSVFTIHNLSFQMGLNWWEVPPNEKDYGRSRLPHLDDPRLKYINFVKRAILTADAVSTVSEQYREEIMTKNFGQDLHRILKNRQDRLFGIVNGIDTKHYNPANDPGLAKNYDHRAPGHKTVNKLALQEKFGLAMNARAPLLCATSRVTFQKGSELILKIIGQLAKHDLQLIVVGSGDKAYISEFKKAARRHPKKIVVLPTHEDNQRYETLCYAASDMFLLPSQYEPCGINQLIAMRYGCIPIVRRVGGLNDTVTDYNPATGAGTGFVFNDFNELSLYRAVVRAVENYRRRDDWRMLVQRAMRQSNSWELPAKKYIKLYRETLKR